MDKSIKKSINILICSCNLHNMCVSCIAMIYSNLFVITVNFKKSVRYNHEGPPIKHAEPNQTTQFVRYNRVFVITEFDCINPVALNVATVFLGGNSQNFLCKFLIFFVTFGLKILRL